MDKRLKSIRIKIQNWISDIYRAYRICNYEDSTKRKDFQDKIDEFHAYLMKEQYTLHDLITIQRNDKELNFRMVNLHKSPLYNPNNLTWKVWCSQMLDPCCMFNSFGVKSKVHRHMRTYSSKYWNNSRILFKYDIDQSCAKQLRRYIKKQHRQQIKSKLRRMMSEVADGYEIHAELSF